MIPSDCILDISNVFHSTSVVIEGSCINKSEPTAVLRDVSARVHGGEVLAILGSKGSGKRALLDVIGEQFYSFFPSILLCFNIIISVICSVSQKFVKYSVSIATTFSR